MKAFCADLRKHTIELINYEKIEVLPMTVGEIESYNNQIFCHISKNRFHEVNEKEDDSYHDNNEDED